MLTEVSELTNAREAFHQQVRGVQARDRASCIGRYSSIREKK
jgi:hypothetical protein